MHIILDVERTYNDATHSDLKAKRDAMQTRLEKIRARYRVGPKS